MATAAALQAGGALAKGIGGAIKARRSFTEEDERRLQQLVRDRAMGRLGLTSRQEGEIRSDLGGQVTQAQAATEQAAERGIAGAGGGARDVFLARLAGQQRTAEAQREVEREVARADAAERQAQQQELRALTAQKAAARGAAVEAALGGLGAAAQIGGQVALERGAQREAVALQTAQLGVLNDEELLKQFRASLGAQAVPGGLSAEFLNKSWSL
jgi:hypothetical protein